ncbi:MAG: endonuclease NucS [Planctomycetia bacterium]|nr:endonuclease NucS [Planctomycetia bacterium]
MNLLIPYIRLPDHNDPLFQEFTYGDRDQRARRLRDLKAGDHIFFHTTIGGKKCITACYTVARVMDTRDVVKDPNLVSKYKNPHIARWIESNQSPAQDDTMVFGDPITSRILVKPLPFDKKLASGLSLNIPFPEGRSENQAVGSATRSWRKLTAKDVEVLQEAIRRLEELADNDETLSADTVLTTEEVSQVIEKHIEGLIAKDPMLLAHPVKCVRRQVETDEGRIDLLLETTSGEIIVVEVKLHRIGRKAIRQLRNYMKWVKKGPRGKKVSGVIICEGVLPASVDDVMKLKDIDIFCYGWQLKLRRWPQGCATRLGSASS